jgi:hypothetical protein
VPQPGLFVDYNRYLYSRGNPIKYIDPTGHFSDEVIMDNFGCDDWSCVESHFQKGGSHQGLWGWLDILRFAEDGDSVSVDTYATLGSGQQVNVNGAGQFTVRNGKITVTNVSFSGNLQISYAELSDRDFAAFAMAYGGENQHSSMYRSSTYATPYNHASTDCVHNDCVTQGLDGISTSASAVAVGCGLAGIAPCTVVAGGISTGASLIGTARTAYQALNAQATEIDVAVAATTFALSIGRKNNPLVGLGGSLFQWAWDTYRPSPSSYE